MRDARRVGRLVWRLLAVLALTLVLIPPTSGESSVSSAPRAGCGPLERGALELGDGAGRSPLSFNFRCPVPVGTFQGNDDCDGARRNC
jgi:hypothetical protein